MSLIMEATNLTRHQLHLCVRPFSYTSIRNYIKNVLKRHISKSRRLTTTDELFCNKKQEL